MIRNAVAYVSRKKNRTLILFIILTLVLSCLYSCLGIMNSGTDLEKSLYASSNSSLSITKKSNGYFNIEQFRDIKKIKEVKDILWHYEGTAKPVNSRVVEGEQRITLDHEPNDFNNVVSVEATNKTKKNVLFNSGVFKIKEGRHIGNSHRGKILIHEAFAKKNKLKLYDEVALELIAANDTAASKVYKFEIVGIFSGKKQETYTGLSSDFSENMVFIDYESSQQALKRGKSNKIANRITVFSDSQENIKAALNRIKGTKVDWSRYNLEENTNAFDETLESISGIKHIIKIMTYSIILGGLIVLSLILILWIRERIYEVGILLAIGKSKLEIVGQFILEMILISLPVIVASVLLGNLVLSQIIGDFIGSDDSTAVANNLLNNENFLDSLITFLQSYGILIGIIVISVVIACGMILVKKPKEILTRIS